MKKQNRFKLGFVIFVILLSSCQRSGSGPMTWIDQPLENSEFPVGESIILQAHASDSDGVDSIEFYLDDGSLINIASSGSRMGEAFFSWMPPGIGVYTIYAAATDNQGNRGMPASSTIVVGSQVAEVISPQEAPSSFEKSSKEEEEEEEPIQAEIPEEPSNNPEVIPSRAINCRDYPDASSNILDILDKNQSALVVGRLSNNNWFLVIHPDSLINCWVTASLVTTTGDFTKIPVTQLQIPQQPPAEQPHEEQPAPPQEEEPPAPPPPPPADTTPPTIASISISPTTIYQQGCSGEQQTAVLTVEVIDIGGVANVEAAWINGSVKLTHTSGYQYQGTIGPINTTGTILIYGSAVDSSGNWSPFSVNVTVKCCIC